MNEPLSVARTLHDLHFGSAVPTASQIFIDKANPRSKFEVTFPIQNTPIGYFNLRTELSDPFLAHDKVAARSRQVFEPRSFTDVQINLPPVGQISKLPKSNSIRNKACDGLGKNCYPVACPHHRYQGVRVVNCNIRIFDCRHKPWGLDKVT